MIPITVTFPADNYVENLGILISLTGIRPTVENYATGTVGFYVDTDEHARQLFESIRAKFPAWKVSIGKSRW